MWWHINWKCPACCHWSIRGDWYDDHEIDQIRQFIEAGESWQCPECSAWSPADAGTTILLAHSRYTLHGPLARRPEPDKGKKRKRDDD